jgi:muconolactone delta-isomerase
MTKSPKPESNRGTDDNRTDLTGWKRVGEYASYIIYAKDNRRRLVEQKTGKFVLEYVI